MGEDIFEKYLRLLNEKNKLEVQISEHQVKLYNLNAVRFNETDSGTVHYEQDGFKLSVVKKETVKVDQKMAEVVGMAFSSKYSLNKKKYDMLSESDRKRVDECLTTAPGKPTFKVEVIDD